MVVCNAELAGFAFTRTNWSIKLESNKVAGERAEAAVRRDEHSHYVPDRTSATPTVSPRAGNCAPLIGYFSLVK